MIPARKRWGQHFLAHGSVAEKIVAAARISPADTVIEVGPGDGALTRPLATAAARLLAIEIDPARAERLRRELDDGERVRILTGDVLKRPYRDWLAEAGWAPPAILVANLPYNAATAILVAAIEDHGTIARAVATVQREVAERFIARPRSASYGFLSVRAAASSRGRILFDLPPAVFRPRPKVTSSVLELTPREPALPEDLARRAVALASRGFRARRKTLVNALAGSSRDRGPWEDAIAKLGRPGTVRAEELSVEDFVQLARIAPAT
jgi:16S rRNA (adenine1518-N6/adenine1519-N6)-dimethyltransferase